MSEAFLYGILLAFGLILPLGVQNIFIFNQGATQEKLRYAMPSVMTAFVCDMLLIVLSVAGISVAVLTIAWLKTSIFVVGFFFLLYMGWNTWHSQSGNGVSHAEALPAKKQILFATSVSILNPHAIIDSVGVIGTNSLYFTGYDRIYFTFACVLVSFLWFVSLSFAGHFVRSMNNSGVYIRVINKISALIIWAVAGSLGYQLVM